jgi:glycosyltransferase involved in cell wall biosynthesis
MAGEVLPMRVLCVIPKYWPAFQYGGPISSVHYLNKTLVEKGVGVTVYTTNVGLDKSVPVNQEVELDGVKVNYFMFTKLFEFMGATGWQFSLQLTDALKENLQDFDLIYIVRIWSYPAAAAAYYSRRYEKPYIFVPRGMLCPYTFSKKIWKKWLYYYLIVKRNLEGALAIHYTSDDEAEKTHPFLGLQSRPVIIPNGIKLSEFPAFPDGQRLKTRYPHLKDKKIILFLGRIHKVKRLDVLVKAFALLAKEKKDAHLLIAGGGKGTYCRRVKKWIRECGMNAQVTFTGILTGKEKIEAYAGSDIFVLPSYSESFGMAVVEAMACSLAVVISNKVGIYKEVKRNKAGIVIDANTESLHQAMKLLLEDFSLKKEIAANGRKLVEEYYDIDKVADKMIENFRKILTPSTTKKV